MYEFFYGYFSKTIFSITKQTNKREKNVLSFGVFWASFLVITCKRLKLPVLKSFVYFKPVHRYNYTVFALPAWHFFQLFTETVHNTKFLSNTLGCLLCTSKSRNKLNMIDGMMQRKPSEIICTFEWIKYYYQNLYNFNIYSFPHEMPL